MTIHIKPEIVSDVKKNTEDIRPAVKIPLITVNLSTKPGNHGHAEDIG